MAEHWLIIMTVKRPHATHTHICTHEPRMHAQAVAEWVAHSTHPPMEGVLVCQEVLPGFIPDRALAKKLNRQGGGRKGQWAKGEGRVAVAKGNGQRA